MVFLILRDVFNVQGKNTTAKEGRKHTPVVNHLKGQYTLSELLIRWSNGSRNLLPRHLSDVGLVQDRCEELRKYAGFELLSLPLSVSFVTQLLLALFMCITKCNAMNGFQERLSEIVIASLPLVTGWLFTPPSSVATWNFHRGRTTCLTSYRA